MARPRVVIKFHKIFSQWDRKYYWHSSSLFFVFATQYQYSIDDIEVVKLLVIVVEAESQTECQNYLDT